MDSSLYIQPDNWHKQNGNEHSGIFGYIQHDSGSLDSPLKRFIEAGSQATTSFEPTFPTIIPTTITTLSQLPTEPISQPIKPMIVTNPELIVRTQQFPTEPTSRYHHTERNNENLRSPITSNFSSPITSNIKDRSSPMTLELLHVLSMPALSTTYTPEKEITDLVMTSYYPSSDESNSSGKD